MRVASLKRDCTKGPEVAPEDAQVSGVRHGGVLGEKAPDSSAPEKNGLCGWREGSRGSGRGVTGIGPVPKVKSLGPSRQQTNSSGKSCFRVVKTSKTHRTTSETLDDNPFFPSIRKKQTNKKKTKQGERQRRERRRNEKTVGPRATAAHAPPPPGPARVKRCVPFRIQAAAGKWQGCDVNGAGKFFQRMLLRGARAGVTRSERELR